MTYHIAYHDAYGDISFPSGGSGKLRRSEADVFCLVRSFTVGSAQKAYIGSTATIAESTGYSLRQVKKALSHLKELGLVEERVRNRRGELTVGRQKSGSSRLRAYVSIDPIELRSDHGASGAASAPDPVKPVHRNNDCETTMPVKPVHPAGEASATEPVQPVHLAGAASAPAPVNPAHQNNNEQEIFENDHEPDDVMLKGMESYLSMSPKRPRSHEALAEAWAARIREGIPPDDIIGAFEIYLGAYASENGGNQQYLKLPERFLAEGGGLRYYLRLLHADRSPGQAAVNPARVEVEYPDSLVCRTCGSPMSHKNGVDYQCPRCGVVSIGQDYMRACAGQELGA